MITNIICAQTGRSFKGDGVEIPAIRNVSAAFHNGDFSAIVGPSGSGKSTLLSLIGTLDKPTSGKIFYDGEEMIGKSKKKLADFRFHEIGFIFQQFHLLPTLTALENVLTPLFARKVPYSKVKRAKEVLNQVGLSDKYQSLPSQLSGGQQQRVAIARAIVHKPSWLLADEPTGNLDTATGEQIFHLLQKLHQEEGCGVIFVTHDPSLAAKADRVLTMEDGILLSDKKGISV
jgi:putative ABC transport system ATP-binding protein/lipoprotein-releasing system ATP-binding protein